MLKEDIDTILHQTLGCATPLDELALLRSSLRWYVRIGNAGEAVRRAAIDIADSINYASNSRPDQEP